jgi:hypothetical protein
MDIMPASGNHYTEESIVFYASGVSNWRQYPFKLQQAKLAHSSFDLWFRKRMGDKKGEITYYALQVWVYKFLIDDSTSERFSLGADYRSMSSQLVWLALDVGGYKAAEAFEAFVEGGGKPYIFSDKPDRPRRRDMLLNLIRGRSPSVMYFEIRQDERK